MTLKRLTEHEASSSSVVGATSDKDSGAPDSVHAEQGASSSSSSSAPHRGGRGQHAFASTPTLDNAHRPDWREVWCGKDEGYAAEEGGRWGRGAEGGSARGGGDEEGGGKEGEGGEGLCSSRRDATSCPAPKKTSNMANEANEANEANVHTSSKEIGGEGGGSGGGGESGEGEEAGGGEGEEAVGVVLGPDGRGGGEEDVVQMKKKSWVNIVLIISQKFSI
jgi:hypothetical protein